jgi:hypothetical protein
MINSDFRSDPLVVVSRGRTSGVLLKNYISTGTPFHMFSYNCQVLAWFQSMVEPKSKINGCTPFPYWLVWWSELPATGWSSDPVQIKEYCNIVQYGLVVLYSGRISTTLIHVARFSVLSHQFVNDISNCFIISKDADFPARCVSPTAIWRLSGPLCFLAEETTL